MQKTSIDMNSVVRAAAQKLDESDLTVAKAEVEAQVEGRAWNMNQPLNMIAYEDQK